MKELKEHRLLIRLADRFLVEIDFVSAGNSLENLKEFK